MTPRAGSAQARTVRPRRGEQFQDEVYRQMFRLEASHPGAEMDLALALLRAWLAADSRHKHGEDRRWLKKICPICLAMIEDAMQAGNAPNRFPRDCPF